VLLDEIIKMAFYFENLFFVGSFTDYCQSNIFVCPEQLCEAQFLHRASALDKAKSKGHTSECKAVF
jgi:hypothetical protein